MFSIQRLNASNHSRHAILSDSSVPTVPSNPMRGCQPLGFWILLLAPDHPAGNLERACHTPDGQNVQG